ncbi:GNAT family N-acetyltransferase [Corynebacterium testudinoris]|uniref:GNAT family N-acetyltransferase n=1 Tax=Corynebacterium testudinoris TaxID=136857 RepID=UPI001C8BBF2F|nr:GNAT family protein [Corynebacterium testudinoris]MBX8995660.1 GNAT family N-acetyltransferase [Corynebacterium testudinoris]
MLDPLGLSYRRVSRPGSGPRDLVHPGWPESTPVVQLTDGSRLRLRPLMRRDGRDWSEYRTLDESFLKPVEPTMPEEWETAHSPSAFWRFLTGLRSAAQRGQVVPFAIELNGAFAGQVTLGSIQHGSISDCWIGYWVHSAFMGRGVATAACALGTDHAFLRIGLHRVTATYLPDNPASGRVLALNGFRQAGFLHGNLHIDGRWQDHHLVAQNREDHRGTCVSRLREQGRLL